MARREFAIIERYFRGLGPRDGRVRVDAGDDCAVLALASEELAMSMDTLVEGVHFPAGSDGTLVARRAFAACTSDLAAMGADPFAFQLALTLPRADDAWLEAFSGALAGLADLHHMRLVGGDLTEGPLAVTLQVLGSLPCGQGLLRSGAKPGDLVCVTGSLGNARAGLELPGAEAGSAAALHAAYTAPTARIAAGKALLDHANAAIDISDGLLADVTHLVVASSVGAELDAAKLPIDAALREAFPGRALDFALTGGDDYELCFTLPEAGIAACARALAPTGAACLPIGRVTRKTGVRLVNLPDGYEPIEPGYSHF